MQFKSLTVCLLPVVLAACGGGDDSGSSKEAPQIMPVSDKYPEPIQDNDDAVLGFYDYDKDGQPRLIRNDLSGSFSAMIQFGQSHVVNPNDNEKDHMPRLTAEKDALLLVTPTLDMGDITALKADIYLDNRLLRTIDLVEPALIPESDQSNEDDRPRVRFSKRAWSAALTWEEIRPGLNIRIIDSTNSRDGALAADDIDFAAPGELVLQSIRLGMLTDPPVSDNHQMLLEPAKAGTDFLQTIPAARLIVTKYDDLKLDKVMLGSGVVYDTASSGAGDVHNGDMREDTAKLTISMGINLANWGVTSASLKSTEQPQVTQSVVAHHARGKYSNGDVIHDASGGNGMLTVNSTVGNMLSHEIGHHFGLGHYPGEDNGNMFWAAHHANSGWGYIAFRDKMRGNLHWKKTELSDGNDGVPNFLEIYDYAWDAMSGAAGGKDSLYSKYTHYTGYSTQTKIQPAFDKYVWDARSSTGYKKWNPVTRVMEVAQPKVPSSTKVWYNSADGNFLKPRMFGVPVYTILGGYDPENQKGLIYPAARGNWGNVFNLPQVDPNATAANCWLDVQLPSSTQYIALAPQRMDPNSVNKFHVNIAQRDKPQKVDLYCKKDNQAAELLSSIDIPASATPLDPYVEIGKAVGYTALRTLELPQLDQALLESKGKASVYLSPEMEALADSYKAYKHELSPAAQFELERYFEQQEKLHRLNRWMNAYEADLIAENPEAVNAFRDFVESIGLKEEFSFDAVTDHATPLLTQAKNGDKACLKVETLEDGQLNVFISAISGCEGDNSELWVYDLFGKIHSKKHMDQCLKVLSDDKRINLSDCINEERQIWVPDFATQAIKQKRYLSKCFDLPSGQLGGGRAELHRWNCNGGISQQWTQPKVSENLLLSGLSDKKLALAAKLMRATP